MTFEFYYQTFLKLLEHEDMYAIQESLSEGKTEILERVAKDAYAISDIATKHYLKEQQEKKRN